MCDAMAVTLHDSGVLRADQVDRRHGQQLGEYRCRDFGFLAGIRQLSYDGVNPTDFDDLEGTPILRPALAERRYQLARKRRALILACEVRQKAQDCISEAYPVH